MVKKKVSLLFVGAFPPPEKVVFGGNITACKALLDAGLAEYVDLILLDSTQHSVPPPSWGRRLLYSLPRILRYLRLVVRYRPDSILIFASTGFSFLEKSLLAALGYFWHSRVLVFPRGGRLMDDCRRKDIYRFFVKFMLRFSDILLCQGEVWRNFFVNEMGFPEEKCVVINNWTASPALLNIGSTRNYNEIERHRILFLGWVYRTKGIFELIDAFAVLHQKFPKLELLIAGEGEAFDETKQYVFQKDFDTAVSFLGWIDGECKLNVLSYATIFCLPSHMEGFPNAMIEAMATGLPVVVTPVGSIPDSISHRKNGLIVPVRDSHSLALALEELIVNPKLHEQIGRSGYETAKNDYSAVRAIRQFVEVVTSTV